MENGYAICFNEWALDKDIKNELGLLIIISSLSAEKGYCFASNKYLSELFDIEEETISRKLSKLVSKDYITIDYEKRGCEIVDRKIRLTKISIHDCQKYQSTIDEKIKDNNISINNTSNNIKEIYKEKNVNPTLEEIEEYCKSRNNNIDAKKFYDYYSVNNWKDIKGNKIKNWKQKIITWEGRNTKDIKQDMELPTWFDKDIQQDTTESEDLNELKDFFKGGI